MEEPNLEVFEYYCKKFRKPFRFGERFTPWKCPHCVQGQLVANIDNFVKTNVEVSVDDDEFYLFSGYFSCNICTKKTSTLGHGAIEYHYQTDTDTGEEHVWEDETCTPTFFFPPIALFRPAEGTPKSVVDALNRSFSIAWSDISASCNVLRVAVEKLFKELWPDVKVKNLHSKIEFLNKNCNDDPKITQVCTYLMAIKFLGNDASHDDVLEERDLAVAFELIEQVLNLLFDTKPNKLNIWAAMITAAEGRPIK